MKGGEMKEGLKRIGLGLVAVGLSITLLLIGAIPACEAGPDERVVKIGHHVALTGALASTYVPVVYGTNDMARYINEQGGINGVTYEIPWQDGRSALPNAIPIHRRLVEVGEVGEITYHPTAAEALAPRYQRDEIPCLYVTGFTPPNDNPAH